MKDVDMRLKGGLAIFLVVVLAGMMLWLAVPFTVAVEESALSPEGLQARGLVVAPVPQPTTSDRSCSRSVVVSVTVMSPDWTGE